MNRKGEVDVVAIVILSLMIIALFVAMQMGVSYLNKVTGKSSQAQKDSGAKAETDQLQPRLLDKVEGLIRSQSTEKRHERVALVAQINNIVKEINTGNDELNKAIDKFNEATTPSDNQEAFSEIVGRLEANNLMKRRLISSLIEFKKFIPDERRQKDAHEISQLDLNLKKASELTDESDGFIKKCMSEPTSETTDEIKLLQKANIRHQNATDALRSAHRYYDTLERIIRIHES